jgi:hypothetical protein
MAKEREFLGKSKGRAALARGILPEEAGIDSIGRGLALGGTGTGTGTAISRKQFSACTLEL